MRSAGSGERRFLDLFRRLLCAVMLGRRETRCRRLRMLFEGSMRGQALLGSEEVIYTRNRLCNLFWSTVAFLWPYKHIPVCRRHTRNGHSLWFKRDLPCPAPSKDVPKPGLSDGSISKAGQGDSSQLLDRRQALGHVAVLVDHRGGRWTA